MNLMNNLVVTARVCITAAILTAAGGIAADAEEILVKVGRSQASTYAFTALDIGMEKGIFEKHGLKIESYNFGGDAKLQQGMASGAIDIGLGSGPGLSAAAKGAPVIGIAAMVDQPKQVALVVRNDGPQSVEGLKGKTISVSSSGSLTDWLAHELAKKEGWQASDLDIQALGATSTSAAALKAGQIDGMVVDLATAYLFVDDGSGRILVRFDDIVKSFHTHMIFARAGLPSENPEMIKAFLAGWFETIQYMKDHRDDAVAISGRVMGTTPATSAKLYDELIPVYNTTGKPDGQALEVIKQSQVENGTIPADTDMSKLIDTRFLPGA